LMPCSSIYGKTEITGPVLGLSLRIGGVRATHHSRCVAILVANAFALLNRPPWSLSLHPGRLAWLTLTSLGKAHIKSR
jgi:hypothetical protein